MAAVDDPKTLGRARLSFADTAEIDEFVSTLDRFERGELTADQWRAFRLVRGTYGQRQAIDAQMLRVKIPQGILDARQWYALADVAERYSRGFGHITTRQNLQFHFVKLHDIEPAMRRLAEAGLTTREACGSAVRNITACALAGVAHDEVFDTTPYADALTRYLLRHPLSASLPRKFKIAFEGCTTDHVGVSINDIGWRAQRDGNGRPGFRVTVAGGTSIMCKSGAVLYDFLPATDMFVVTEAVIRVYAALGDYQHKQRNRMKFLIKQMGWDVWRAEFERTLVLVRAEGGPTWPFDPEVTPVEAAPAWARGVAPPAPEFTATRVAAAELNGPGIRPHVGPTPAADLATYQAWLATNVGPQKQVGYRVVAATVPLGDLTGQQMRVLADVAAAFGDGTVRVTADQGLLFRWVAAADVPLLHAHLVAAGLGQDGAGTIADVTSCPGAESCRLAVTQSRGLGKLLGDTLRARPEKIAGADALRIKISGCPNGCGLHHIAAIGFQGSVRRFGNQALPQYFVLAGGGLEPNGAHFGRVVAKLPVRRAPEAASRLATLFDAERHDGESAARFFARQEVVRLKALLADLEAVRPEDVVPGDYIDLGEEAAFSPDMLEGECSA